MVALAMPKRVTFSLIREELMGFPAREGVSHFGSECRGILGKKVGKFRSNGIHKCRARGVEGGEGSQSYAVHRKAHYFTSVVGLRTIGGLIFDGQKTKPSLQRLPS
jgi:hypothetical protein